MENIDFSLDTESKLKNIVIKGKIKKGDVYKWRAKKLIDVLYWSYEERVRHQYETRKI